MGRPTYISIGVVGFVVPRMDDQDVDQEGELHDELFAQEGV